MLYLSFRASRAFGQRDFVFEEHTIVYMLMQVTGSMVEGLKEKISQVKERYAHHIYVPVHY